MLGSSPHGMGIAMPGVSLVQMEQQTIGSGPSMWLMLSDGLSQIFAIRVSRELPSCHSQRTPL